MTGNIWVPLLIKILRGFAMTLYIINNNSAIDNYSYLRYIAVIRPFTDGDRK